MSYKEMKIEEYQNILSAKKSAPGGGSALALVLETSISLCLMVCNFTIDKKGYEKERENIIKMIEELNNMKVIAYKLMDDDSTSFLKLMEAYKSKDSDLISLASIDACEVPFQLYLLTEQVQKRAQYLSLHGNKNVISDAIIARDLCSSIYEGCVLNVKANIPSIKDISIKEKYKTIL